MKSLILFASWGPILSSLHSHPWSLDYSECENHISSVSGSPSIWYRTRYRMCILMHWSQQTPSSNNTREDSTHGHHQMVNTEIRLIIFFAAKDGEALYSQQKQAWELSVAQTMNSLLPNSDWNWRKRRKPLDHSGMTQVKFPYEYTVEVRNRFKGLDLIDRVPDELWSEVRDIV